MILPELGGRIQMAYDKTNDYHFIYYNRVIKPALVGLAGPWISGGIEFNLPQHHRPSTYLPVDYRIVQNGQDNGKRVFRPSPGTPGEGRGEGSSVNIENRSRTSQNPHPNPLPE